MNPFPGWYAYDRTNSAPINHESIGNCMELHGEKVWKMGSYGDVWRIIEIWKGRLCNDTQLVFETFDLAIQKYPDAHPLFHSDRGFQYTSKRFKTNLDKQKMTQSMSRVGRCIDNGPMEGFWGTLKCEMYYLSRFETYEELATAIEQFIHYYNHKRRQHKLNCLPPATYRSLLEAA